ncbi:MAG: ABC transporter permease, partial [Chloroflexi bacterium]
ALDDRLGLAGRLSQSSTYSSSAAAPGRSCATVLEATTSFCESCVRAPSSQGATLLAERPLDLIALPRTSRCAAPQPRTRIWCACLPSFGVSVLSFVVAVAGLYIFAVWLYLPPVPGYVSPGRSPDVGKELSHLILPASIFALEFVAGFMRYARGSMLAVMREQYVTTARARGLSERASCFNTRCAMLFYRSSPSSERAFGT